MRKSAILCALFCLARVGSAQEVIEGEYLIKRGASRIQAAYVTPLYSTRFHSSTADVVKIGAAAVLQSVPSKQEIVPYNPALAALDCEAIFRDPTIERCEPNFVKYYFGFPNDPLSSFQTWHYDPSSDGVETFDLRSPFGWDIHSGTRSVVVGIIDSGINYDHPDLVNNLWRNPGEIAANGVDDDGNGFIDDVIGIDANESSSNPRDCFGHGSHVSGIIGAEGDNGVGVTGVSWQVQMIMIRDSVDCSSKLSSGAVVRGLDYLFDLKALRGVDLVAINGSYGGPAATQAEREAISRLGMLDVVFVAAAGNGGSDGVGDNIDIDPTYPASYQLDNIITVANIDTYDIPNRLALTSNYGTRNVDIAAPGSEVLSTLHAGGGTIPGYGSDYGYLSGTSMSAPMVTGAVALLRSQRPHLRNHKQVIDLILQSAFPVPALQGKIATGGMLNLVQLLSAPDPEDLCPDDPSKLHPGHCGCGKPEIYTDSDLDGIADCGDGCPSDPAKLVPGECGCGVLDLDINLNGIVDCKDVAIESIVPVKPTAVKEKRKVVVSFGADQYPGAIYVVHLLKTTTRLNKRGKRVKRTFENFFAQESAQLVLARPKRGTRYLVSYSLGFENMIEESAESEAITVR